MSFTIAVAFMDMICKDKEVISVLGSSIGFTSSKILPTSGLFKGIKCKGALVFVEGNAIYWTYEGSDADSTCPILYPGQNLPIKNIQNIENFRALRVNDDATIKVLYYW